MIHPTGSVHFTRVTSREVIKASTDIFARIGFPEEIVSGNG